MSVFDLTDRHEREATSSIHLNLIAKKVIHEALSAMASPSPKFKFRGFFKGCGVGGVCEFT